MANAVNAEAPPSYHEDGPQLTYDNFFGKVKEARRSADGNADFLKSLCGLVFGTIGFTILLGIIMAVPVSMIAIGSIYLNDCKAEPYIPIYLIVGGVFGVVHNLLFMCMKYTRDKDDKVETKSGLLSLISCFVTAWFIAGCVWIYRTYQPDYEDVTSDHYCHKTLYLFSFWLTNLAFIGLGVAMFLACCLCVIAILLDG